MKFLIPHGSRLWTALMVRANPAIVPLGVHDGFVVVKYRSRIWKVIGGGPQTPTLREVYRHDFTRPA